MVLLRDHDDRLLLVRQPPSTGWSLPGGLLDRHEHPRDAAVREVREEIGVTLDADAVAPIVPNAHVNPFVQQVDLIFTATVDADATEVTVDQVEIGEARWFALDALPPLTGPTFRLLGRAGLLSPDGSPAHPNADETPHDAAAPRTAEDPPTTDGPGARGTQPDVVDAAGAQPNDGDTVDPRAGESGTAGAQPRQDGTASAQPRQDGTASAQPDDADAAASRPDEISAADARPDGDSPTGAQPDEGSTASAHPHERGAAGAQPKDADAASAESTDGSTASPRAGGDLRAAGTRPDEDSTADAQPDEDGAAGPQATEGGTASARPDDGSAAGPRNGGDLRTALPPAADGRGAAGARTDEVLGEPGEPFADPEADVAAAKHDAPSRGERA
ncbi:ADP-ribose pyrophosphatase YjhB, NUDIX family [Cryptosporangium aurantiacum]|uniref:ADP-ribose pyrophosphatase YjhB, NUDIX family n=1 Tax=Cryptosporangium aurantiacum TaxID=134849 RepID=A0A1M7R7F8_9ACTN|nr:ADP-ribose pyrophosphatase YjhB, NUDIX family [Cryptosporangium aurantiacum]